MRGAIRIGACGQHRIGRTDRTRLKIGVPGSRISSVLCHVSRMAQAPRARRAAKKDSRTGTPLASKNGIKSRKTSGVGSGIAADLTLYSLWRRRYRTCAILF